MQRVKERGKMDKHGQDRTRQDGTGQDKIWQDRIEKREEGTHACRQAQRRTRNTEREQKDIEKRNKEGTTEEKRK